MDPIFYEPKTGHLITFRWRGRSRGDKILIRNAKKKQIKLLILQQGGNANKHFLHTDKK